MDHTRDRLSEPPARGGVANDLHKLRTNGAASAAELREFLSSIRGKSPEDALGAFASSNLIQALLISTIGFVLVIGVFTVVPYMLNESAEAANNSSKSKTAAQSAPKSTTAEKGPTKTTATSSESTAETPPANPTASEPDLNNAARVLGIDETKGTNPAEAPDLDSILDRSLD